MTYGDIRRDYSVNRCIK